MNTSRIITTLSGIALLFMAAVQPAAAANTIFSCHQTGTGIHFLKVCISKEGNLLHFESPQGEDQFFHEGYAVCYAPQGQLAKVAYDSGFGDSGWGPATSSAANKFPLVITRSTNDGALRLKQTFTWDTVTKDIIITIEVTNVSGKTLAFQSLARYFNVNFMPHPPYQELLDRTDFSVTAHATYGNPEGVMLTRLTDNGTTAVHAADKWMMNVCNQTSAATPAMPGTDWVGRISVPGYSMAPGKTETIKFAYKRY